MYNCSRCQKEIDPEQVPFFVGRCWPCHTPGDRQAIKERFRESPSITENALCTFIEWYEEKAGIVFVNDAPTVNEVDFQAMAGTTGQNFWERSTLTPAEPEGFKMKPGDKRRPAPGLEKNA